VDYLKGVYVWVGRLSCGKVEGYIFGLVYMLTKYKAVVMVVSSLFHCSTSLSQKVYFDATKKPKCTFEMYSVYMTIHQQPHSCFLSSLSYPSYSDSRRAGGTGGQSTCLLCAKREIEFPLSVLGPIGMLICIG
jgi:hypothetical protein